MGPGVKKCGEITLGHAQKLAKRREQTDSGTFSDLIHLLEGVERSELVLGGPIPPRRLWKGCNGSWGDNLRCNHSGTSPEVDKTARKVNFCTFPDLIHLLEGVERSELVLVEILPWRLWEVHIGS